MPRANILRLLVCVIGVLCFGVVVTEIINAFHLFDFRVPTLLVAAPMVAIFLFSELAGRYRKAEDAGGREGMGRLRRVLSAYDFVLFVLFIALAALIPYLWWSTIKKLAGMANAGKVLY